MNNTVLETTLDIPENNNNIKFSEYEGKYTKTEDNIIRIQKINKDIDNFKQKYDDIIKTKKKEYDNIKTYIKGKIKFPKIILKKNKNNSIMLISYFTTINLLNDNINNMNKCKINIDDNDITTINDYIDNTIQELTDRVNTTQNKKYLNEFRNKRIPKYNKLKEDFSKIVDTLRLNINLFNNSITKYINQINVTQYITKLKEHIIQIYTINLKNQNKNKYYKNIKNITTNNEINNHINFLTEFLKKIEADKKSYNTLRKGYTILELTNITSVSQLTTDIIEKLKKAKQKKINLSITELNTLIETFKTELSKCLNGVNSSQISSLRTKIIALAKEYKISINQVSLNTSITGISDIIKRHINDIIKKI
jgi:hypothetical protein